MLNMSLPIPSNVATDSFYCDFHVPASCDASVDLTYYIAEEKLAIQIYLERHRSARRCFGRVLFYLVAAILVKS